MKRFSFSLEKLLGLREFREKEAEIALGKANASRDAIQLELNEIGRKRIGAALERQGSLPFAELRAIENYITRLDAKKETLLEDLAAAELVVERMREAYLEKTKERRVLSMLKDKKTEVWRKERLEDDAATLDDISNSRKKTD